MSVNIDDLTIGQVQQLMAAFRSSASQAEHSPFLNKHVVVRTYSAGVHLGTVVEKIGTNVVLKDARRLWKWEGAFTLSEVATAGVKKSGSRISIAVPMIELTQAIELIPTSEPARATFDACHEE